MTTSETKCRVCGEPIELKPAGEFAINVQSAVHDHCLPQWRRPKTKPREEARKPYVD